MAVGKDSTESHKRTRFLGLKTEGCLLSFSFPFVYLLPLKIIRELFSTIFLKEILLIFHSNRLYFASALKEITLFLSDYI